MGRTSINFFSYLKLSLVLLIIVFSSISTSGEALPNAKIAIVYSIGGLGDLSFNDAANKGLVEAMAANPGITTAQVEPTDFGGVASAIESFAADGTYDLIIGIGFIARDGITTSATAHPIQKFMIVDNVVDLPNVISVLFAEHEGSFLAGAVAAMVSITNDIAFLGGLDIPLINKFFAGYYEGARYINPGITVRKVYSPDQSNPWGDLAGGKTVGLELIANGSDIIYSVAGGTGLGVMDAVEEASTADKKIYAIGVDTDQDPLKPGFVLTSMIKHIDVAVFTQIQAIVDGTWAPGTVELGLAENGVGISGMNFTQAEANTEYERGLTRLEKIDEIRDRIIFERIIVKDVLVDYVADPLLEDVVPDLSSPDDIEYIVGETDNFVKWEAGDANPYLVDVYRDGSHIVSDEKWHNGTIIIRVDNLIIGVYELTINIFDKSNNMNTDTVLVTVIEEPTIIPTTPDVISDDNQTSIEDVPTLGFLNFPILVVSLSLFAVLVAVRKKNYPKLN